VFTDLHEFFLCDFPYLLQEWILKMIAGVDIEDERQPCNKLDPTNRVDHSSDHTVVVGE
jgi:hypothetical protein